MTFPSHSESVARSASLLARVEAQLGSAEQALRAVFSVYPEPYTAMTRPKRAGLVRNAAVAIGNRANPADAPALRAALETESDAMVRAHLAWALARCTS